MTRGTFVLSNVRRVYLKMAPNKIKVHFQRSRHFVTAIWCHFARSEPFSHSFLVSLRHTVIVLTLSLQTHTSK